MTRTKREKRELTVEETVRRLSLVSVLGNAVLSGFKLFAGVVGHSGAMISDAIHSFSDVLTTLIAWLGVRFSQKEADESHPYGHERLECVAALVLGIVLLFTGLGVGKAGVETILAGNYQNLEAPGAIALLAAILSIGGKEWMYWYTRYHAKRIRSQAFLADAWHHRSDAFSSVGSLVGIGGAMLGFPVLDSLASVVICLFIVKVAYDITRDALVKMLDTSWDKAEEEAIRQYVSSMDQVERVDRLRTRMFGSRVYVDLEIAVNGDKSLREAHGVAERVHRQVEEQFQDVKHIMVHVNPAPQTGN